MTMSDATLKTLPHCPTNGVHFFRFYLCVIVERMRTGGIRPERRAGKFAAAWRKSGACNFRQSGPNRSGWQLLGVHTECHGPDGDDLTFSIQNKPAWTDFDTQTGQLSGIAQLGDVGTHGEIKISVSDGNMSAALPDFSMTVQNVSTNSAPQISGVPTTRVMADQQYLFLPSASDPDGDDLTFAIANGPGWASFDTRTGRLGGTPVEGDEGIYNNVVISASDGEMSAALPAFSVTVEPASKPPPIMHPRSAAFPRPW